MKEKNESHPFYMYHKEFGARLFKSKEELKDAGKGWEDSPAKLEESPKPKKGKE